MKRNIVAIVWLLAVGFICAGCATVDPRLDYDRTHQQIAAATGVETVFSPEDAIAAESYVAHLLADGLAADEAVQIALLNNPTLQASFLEIGMARADVVQAGLLSNPLLGISAKLPSGGGLAGLEGGIAQSITDLWQIAPRKRAAARSLDRTILSIARQASALAAKAKGAYYEAVAADQQYGIAQDNLVIASDLLGLSKARQEAGAANALEVNLSRSMALKAELQVEATRLDSGDARRELALLLGLSTDAHILELIDRLPEIPSEIPDAESLVQLARSRRLDIRAAVEAVGAAEARWQQERRRVFQLVKLGVAFERGERPRSSGGQDFLADTFRASVAEGGLTVPQIQLPGNDDKHTDFVIGPSLSLQLPIFDQNQAQIAKARYAFQQAVSLLKALDRAVVQEIYGVADRARNARKVLGMYRDSLLPLGQSNLDLSHDAYQAGRASFLEVLESQRFFLQIRSEQIAAARAAAAIVPELESVIGLPFERILAQFDAEIQLPKEIAPSAEEQGP